MAPRGWASPTLSTDVGACAPQRRGAGSLGAHTTGVLPRADEGSSAAGHRAPPRAASVPVLLRTASPLRPIRGRMPCLSRRTGRLRTVDLVLDDDLDPNVEADGEPIDVGRRPILCGEPRRSATPGAEVDGGARRHVSRRCRPAQRSSQGRRHRRSSSMATSSVTERSRARHVCWILRARCRGAASFDTLRLPIGRFPHRRGRSAPAGKGATTISRH